MGVAVNLCLSVVLAVACIASLGACEGRGGETNVMGSTQAEHADRLVEVFSRRAGAGITRLDEQGEAAIDGVELRYDRSRDSLFARVYVNMAVLKGATPQAVASYRQMVSALNDPAIGGMFERAGGYFALDEDREAYFLVREYPLATTNPDKFCDGIVEMQEVAAVWTTTWLRHVARIMHGTEARPKRPVTRTDNPYNV